MKDQLAFYAFFFLLYACFAALSSAQDFDFFYFVQQWPGSYCDTKRSCCYPTTGKPAADFGIHGLWPNYNSGSYPSDCDPDSPYDASQVRALQFLAFASRWGLRRREQENKLNQGSSSSQEIFSSTVKPYQLRATWKKKKKKKASYPQLATVSP
ncbi:hypothetical protein HPP92_010950 [Vanilla planifolia]|uniref:Uncharacterized protein n=1 Tax=Vanilla planifolia TaxID=51239 RepID=A0A835R540_VANPL|nr:hypothetical protein HPP92_010950 [Vanilla planifolia]